MRYPKGIAALIVLTALFFVGTLPAQAQQSQPQPTTTEPLLLFTQFPSQTSSAGEESTFELVLRTGTAAQTIRLEVADLPAGWTASFRGDGRTVQSAFVEPLRDTTLDLRVEPAAGAAADTYRFTVIARGQGSESRLPIELVINERAATGIVLDVELPTLRGAPDTTFRYSATLRNESDQEKSVNLLANAPRGLNVEFQLAGQSVTSVPLAANESKTLNIEATLFPDTPAGSYSFDVQAQGGDAQASVPLVAEVVGRPQLSLSTPDGRLSGDVYAGQSTPLRLLIQNEGSAPARNIQVSASNPAGWNVTFEPAEIPELAAGGSVEVTANVSPAEQALPGDYVLTMRATPEESAAESAEFRLTVLTSTLWGAVGVGLIAVSVLVVGLAVMRFGRR